MRQRKAKTTKESRVCCIINRRSGTAGESPERLIKAQFAKHCITVQVLEPTESSSLASLAEDAVQQNYDMIIAGGGDGTINAVASAIVGNSKIKFGVLPMGTFNHFARDLGIPFDLEKAIENIVAGNVKSVDVGEVNDRIFVNNSSLGLYPAMVRLREGLQKTGHRKLFAAAWASLRIFTRFRRLRLELHPAKGTMLKRNASMLFVGNNPYEMNFSQLGKRLALDQGQLWVMMPTSSSRWGLMGGLIAVLFGYENTKELFVFDAPKLTVASRRRRLLEVAVDGEVLQLQSPLTYRIRPKSLQVIVPTGEVPHNMPVRKRSRRVSSR